MYQWLLDQGITKLYSVHKQVPKQIKGTPKLENELYHIQQFQMLKCTELEDFIEIIENAKLFNKKIGTLANLLYSPTPTVKSSS